MSDFATIISPSTLKEIEYRLKQNAILLHTFNLFDESQSAIWIGCCVLLDPDTQPVILVTAVIQIEL